MEYMEKFKMGHAPKKLQQLPTSSFSRDFQALHYRYYPYEDEETIRMWRNAEGDSEVIPDEEIRITEIYESLQRAAIRTLVTGRRHVQRADLQQLERAIAHINEDKLDTKGVIASYEDLLLNTQMQLDILEGNWQQMWTYFNTREEEIRMKRTKRQFTEDTFAILLFQFYKFAEKELFADRLREEKRKADQTDTLYCGTLINKPVPVPMVVSAPKFDNSIIPPKTEVKSPSGRRARQSPMAGGAGDAGVLGGNSKDIQVFASFEEQKMFEKLAMLLSFVHRLSPTSVAPRNPGVELFGFGIVGRFLEHHLDEEDIKMEAFKNGRGYKQQGIVEQQKFDAALEAQMGEFITSVISFVVDLLIERLKQDEHVSVHSMLRLIQIIVRRDNACRRLIDKVAFIPKLNFLKLHYAKNFHDLKELGLPNHPEVKIPVLQKEHPAFVLPAAVRGLPGGKPITKSPLPPGEVDFASLDPLGGSHGGYGGHGMSTSQSTVFGGTNDPQSQSTMHRSQSSRHVGQTDPSQAAVGQPGPAGRAARVTDKVTIRDNAKQAPRPVTWLNLKQKRNPWAFLHLTDIHILKITITDIERQLIRYLKKHGKIDSIATFF